MRLVDLLLPEFDHEMSSTRRVLERAPESSFTWRPHDKSWTLAGLATHLSNIPRWGASILAHESYDLAESDGQRWPELSSVGEALAAFDAHVQETRAALIGMTEGQLIVPWSLKRGKTVMMSMPRIQAFKHFAISHAVHHRGQLTVYLRLLNVPLPPTYGPTADEGA